MAEKIAQNVRKLDQQPSAVAEDKDHMGQKTKHWKNSDMAL